jgi:hypothetical protein
LIGQGLAGHRSFNEDRREHGRTAIGLAAYLRSGHFLESVFENWESEFFQMGAFVLLTIFLRQKGSSASKAVDESTFPRRVRSSAKRNAPWPVRRGGWALRIYRHSLTLALLLLFLGSFVGHAAGGAASYSEEQTDHGGQPVTVLGYVATPRFWFESFQNWQSEFLSVAVLITLSIYLRQEGSPQSKEVAEPHAKTGTD